MTSPLAAVRTFRIDSERLYDTVNVLAEAGEKGFEAFVLWGGRVSDNGTVVTFERNGVSYTVAGSVPPQAAETAARELQ